MNAEDVLIEVSRWERLAIERLELIKRIQDALGTDEEGDNLVSVANDAHRAEQEWATLMRELLYDAYPSADTPKSRTQIG